jgi:Flp pilus assembly protein TadG
MRNFLIQLKNHRSIGPNRLASRQGGASLILATVSMGLLLAIGGLAVDAGRLFVTKTELQSAMDACALAAAARLNPGNTSGYFLQAAEAAGKAVSDSSKSSLSGSSRPITSVNRAYFQSTAISPGSIDVEFSGNLTGPFLTIGGGAAPATSRFVRCRYDMTGIPLTMIRAVEAVPVAVGGSPLTIASTANVSASAVASHTPGTPGPVPADACSVMPMAVCMGAGSTAASNWGYTRGQRVQAPCVSGNNNCPNPGPGNFGWVDFTPPSGGASELADALVGNGACGGVTIGQNIGQTGVANSVQDAWNTRFGVYAAGGGLNFTNAVPDYTGYSYNPTANIPGGAYDTDYSTRVASAAAFNPSVAWYQNNNFNTGTILTSAQHAIYGRSRRLVTAPVVNCSQFSGGSGLASVQGFACVFLLAPYPATGNTNGFQQNVEFLGAIDPLTNPPPPCVLSGAPGGGGGGGGVTASVPFLVR